jgi:hypothetical protein
MSGEGLQGSVKLRSNFFGEAARPLKVGGGAKTPLGTPLQSRAASPKLRRKAGCGGRYPNGRRLLRLRVPFGA